MQGGELPPPEVPHAFVVSHALPSFRLLPGVAALERSFSYTLTQKRVVVVCLLYWLYRSAWSALNFLESKRLETTFFQLAFQPSPWRASVPRSTIAALSLSVRCSASASNSAIMARTDSSSFAVAFSSLVLILLPPFKLRLAIKVRIIPFLTFFVRL